MVKYFSSSPHLALHGELPGGRDDEHHGPPLLGPALGLHAVAEVGEGGDGEGERLAGPSLRDTDDVAPASQHRPTLSLDTGTYSLKVSEKLCGTQFVDIDKAQGTFILD